MMANTAIEYEHFIKTDCFEPNLNWLGCQLHGKFVIDNGSWRDYGIRQECGVEFELKDDAMKYLVTFGGEYMERKVRT